MSNITLNLKNPENTSEVLQTSQSKESEHFLYTEDIEDIKNIELLQIITLISNELKNPSIKLTPNEIKFINNLISSNPEIFKNIDISIKEIIKDNEINLQDIPEFVLLVVNIFNNTNINTLNDINLTNIIKFIIDTIINNLPYNKQKLEIIIKLIDISIRLLETNILTQENKKKCNDYISNFCNKYCCCYKNK